MDGARLTQPVISRRECWEAQESFQKAGTVQVYLLDKAHCLSLTIGLGEKGATSGFST